MVLACVNGIEKSIKLRKFKKILKKPNREKKPIKILKKLTGSICFINLKPKKLNSNREKTEPKPSQTEKTESNQFKPVFVLKTKPNRNRSI